MSSFHLNWYTVTNIRSNFSFAKKATRSLIEITRTTNAKRALHSLLTGIVSGIMEHAKWFGYFCTAYAFISTKMKIYFRWNQIIYCTNSSYSHRILVYWIFSSFIGISMHLENPFTNNFYYRNKKCVQNSSWNCNCFCIMQDKYWSLLEFQWLLNRNFKMI